MFITFEGLDFSGKSTQIKLLQDYYNARNRKVIVIREPGGTLISEKIRDILLDKKNLAMVSDAEMLLFAASRAQLVNEIIIPELQKNTVVISDRFHDSSIAYQGYGRGISLEFVKALQTYVIRDAVPAITFFIDIPVSEVKRRKGLISASKIDRIESSDENFYNAVRHGYLELAGTAERFNVIDGLQPIETVHKEICRILESKSSL
ncbi:MAG: dTMP kinase [Ignavibacteriales bacterium]|nr:dTMP kinase [Ignavibacteriales bacterium]MCF8307200.1 dTMP kinase [Ignavibacteriales bacterium]MCF8315205.1 dTMP kinase [Ignavibacteriales bacterium]MCF8438480.1 dTMP kinase [Ignavibacteriales bacterium]